MSSLNGPRIRPTRFAHLDGHTDISYTDDGRHILTCGLDGDIRIFKDLDDDDCVTHTVAEHVHCIAFRNGSILAGTNFNLVQSFTLDEGKPDGIITRFTASPTHITVSKDNKLIAVASSDMTVKVHDAENFQDLLFSGHEAPVLSVALDPKRDFLATSSCDGSVRVWNFRTQTLVRNYALLPKSNDFSFSKTLCRLCWSLDGQFLIVPVETDLQIFNRNTWKVEFKLTHSSITGIVSVATVSPCGKFVASGCRDGRIVVWDLEKRMCIASEKSNKVMAITGLVWHPKGNAELAFVNSGGEFGTMVDFLQGEPVPSVASSESKQVIPDNLLEEKKAEVGSTSSFPPSDIPEDMEDGDDDEFSIAKIKSQLGFADDEEGTFIGLPTTNDIESTSRPPSRLDTPLPSTVVAPQLPVPQEPFQPGMSPEHLNDRYMVWNNTGIVRQYRSEEEHSIEVEFHDSSIHHSLHLNNHMGHSLAVLNQEALVLAAESQEDQLSKLVVHHFSAWDGSKEWQTEMPEGEDILAIGIGMGWLAVATDLRTLRIFTTTGVQRDILSIPGPVVCIAGFEKKMLVVYHSGMGVSGEQNLSLVILNIKGHKYSLSMPIPVSMSPKAFLAWLGFTDEGTPMTMDSVGVVRMLNQANGRSWYPVLNTKAHAKGKSDHYFLLGASEIQNVIRCILCKGARYPPVLPRPHVSLLDLKVPVCEPDNEKSVLEEKFLRSKHLSSTIEHLGKDGFDMEGPQNEIDKAIKETMVKLFALACRADRESRGLEVCELMPSANMVEVAIKYAAKLHRIQLAERLNEVVQEKVKESQRAEEEASMELYSSFRNADNNDYDCDTEASSSASSVAVNELPEESRNELIRRNPLLAASCKLNSNKGSALERMTNLTPTTRNPFKRKLNSSGTSKGMQMLDSLKITKKEESPVLKPVMKQPKKQASLKVSSAHQTDKENITISEVNSNTAESNVLPAVSVAAAPKKTSALKLWLEDNKAMVKEKFPTSSETELFVKAAMIFKDVEDSIKQKYKALAAETSQPKQYVNENSSATEEKKRKPESNIASDEPVDKKQKSTFGSKLSAFAFSKKEST